MMNDFDLANPNKYLSRGSSNIKDFYKRKTALEILEQQKRQMLQQQLHDSILSDEN